MAAFEFIMEAPDKGRAIAFPAKSFFIGSAEACQVRFQSDLIEPRHAEVVCDTRGQWWIRDLVANGLVVVNGRPVLDERLSPGDTLRIGHVVMRIHDTGVDLQGRTVSGDNLPQIRVDLVPDSVIADRYRITQKLATGGMGEVYRGVHVELGKPLALKVMLPELSHDEAFVGRFKREAVASSRIGQQNIVDISDFGRTDDGRFFFVMEYVDGKTLKKHLREEGAFSVGRVVHVGLQVARALAAAHAAGIIHRDLKPENVMLLQRPGQPDFVKVLDFGIAKVASTNGTANYTAIGTVVGTPQYMAPEQASGLPVDARSDVYALGLILHELLAGKPVFDADSAVGMMAAQISSRPAPVGSPHGPVPRPLERLVTQMLEKSAAERPASMEAVVAVLEAVASVPTPVGRVPALDPRTASLLARLPLTGLEPALTPAGVEPVTASFTPAPQTLVAPPSGPRPGPTLVASVPAPEATTEHGLEAQPARRREPDTTHALDASGSTDTALEALRPRRTPWLVAGLGMLVLGLLAAVLWLPGNGPAPAKAAVPPAIVVVSSGAATPQPAAVEVTPVPAAAVKLLIDSEPTGAEVYEDDVLLGTTPLALSRPQGATFALRFTLKDHKVLARKVRFESDTAVRVQLEKERGKGPRSPRGGPEEDLKDVPF